MKNLILSVLLSGLVVFLKIDDYYSRQYIEYAEQEPSVYLPINEQVLADIPEIETQETETKTLSDEDFELIARVVMSEASICDINVKVAIAQTVINRWLSGKWGETIADVVYYPNAFSTQDNGDVTERCRYAVTVAIEDMPYPEDMYYFRTGHYHNFGYDYAQVGQFYFSTEGANDGNN